MGIHNRFKCDLPLCIDRIKHLLDEDTDSFWWFLTSFLRGFNIYFILCLSACIIIAECSYIKALCYGHLSLDAKCLITPLAHALPALIGTTILDYGLECGKRPRVTVSAIIILAMIGLIALYCYYGDAQTPHGFYLITAAVVYFTWCIKARDPKMAKNRKAALVIPEKDAAACPIIATSGDIGGGKKVIFERKNVGDEK